MSQCHFWILVPDSIYSTLKLPLVIALVNASHVVQVLYIITLLHVYSNSLSCYYKMMATMSPLVLGPRLFTTIRTFVSITFKLFKHLRIPSMTGTCLSSLHHKISNTISDLHCSSFKMVLFCTITLVGASMPIHVVLTQSCCAAMKVVVPLWVKSCTGEKLPTLWGSHWLRVCQQATHNDSLRELITPQMSSYSLASVISIMLWIITTYHMMKRPYQPIVFYSWRS